VLSSQLRSFHITAVFLLQFDNVTEHNCMAIQEEALYHIAALSETAGHIVQGIATGAMYKDVTEARRYGCCENHPQAVFHCKRKEGPSA
jgi:hypothetical protein